MSTPHSSEFGMPRTTVRELELPVTPEASDQEMLKAVVDYYAATLKTTPAALAFLQTQGVTSAEALATFRLGFSDRSLGLCIPCKNRKAGGSIRERLTALGILKANGHEAFRGALTVPLFDEQGRLVQVYGRMVGDKLRPSVPRNLWLHADRRGVFNLAAFGACDTVIVAGGLLDALAWWCRGHRNVTTVHGPDGPTAELVTAFERHKVARAVVAFTGADGLAAELEPRGIRCSRASEPDDLPTPPAPAPAPPVAASEPSPASGALEPDRDELVLVFGERRYRVRGLADNLSYSQLRVNLLCSREGGPAGTGFHVDSLDLYSAKQRAAFTKQAALELGVAEEVIRGDLGRVLLQLEQEQDRRIQAALTPAEQKVVLTRQETDEATELLKSPDLTERIVADIQRCGLAGEGTNILAAYLGVVSRKLDRPLALLIRSSSGSGKSSLMDAVLAFTPDEDKLCFSSLTPQALYYLGETNLKHRVLAVAEDQGAAKVSYPLKLLLSEGSLTIGSTSKDERGAAREPDLPGRGPGCPHLQLHRRRTGRGAAQPLSDADHRRVAGADPGCPPHPAAPRDAGGLVASQERERLTCLHQNAQRLLRPLTVLNPFAPSLGFSSAQTRMRRAFPQYLTLIKAIALLHQHQRPVRTVAFGGVSVEYIEVEPADVALANTLCLDILGLSLDELPPQARRLLRLLDQMAAEHCRKQGIDRGAYRFGRRDVRAFTGWSDFQVRVHLARLIAMELVVVHQGGRGRLFEYELLFDGREQDGRVVLGLIDPATLASTTATSRGGAGEFVAGSCPQSAPIVGPSRGADSATNAKEDAGLRATGQVEPEIARPGGQPGAPPPYPQAAVAKEVR
ncbi:MAG TPA: hypothetical protein VGK67_38410 [Myxococcales bacterium]|jgi:hypothetical protein